MFKFLVMKALLLAISIFLIFQLNAQASGGVGCEDKQRTIRIEAILGHSAGDPLSNLTLIKGKETIKIPKERIAQYKSNQDEFYVLVLNEAQTEIYFELSTRSKKDRDFRITNGQFLLKSPKEKKWSVECSFE